MARNTIEILTRLVGASEAKKLMADLRNEIKRTDTASKETTRSGDAMTGMYRKLGAAVGAYIGLATANAILREADHWKMLQSRVQLATRTTGDYVAVSGKLYEMSQKNAAALEGSVNLFQQLARSAPELNATNDQVLGVMNTVQQLGVVSGATGEMMKNSLLQFSQAMAGGIVRAEEFNSILENTPALMASIADGMGMTVGQLRNAVIEGKVLSKDVFKALESQAGNVQEMFDQMPNTIDYATTRLGNAWTKFIGGLEESMGLARGLADIIDSAADSLDRLAGARQRLGDSVAEELSRSLRVLQSLETQLQFATGGKGNFITRMFGDEEGLRAKIDEMRQLVDDLKRQMGTLSSEVGGVEDAYSAANDELYLSAGLTATLLANRKEEKTVDEKLAEKAKDYNQALDDKIALAAMGLKLGKEEVAVEAAILEVKRKGLPIDEKTLRLKLETLAAINKEAERLDYIRKQQEEDFDEVLKQLDEQLDKEYEISKATKEYVKDQEEEIRLNNVRLTQGEKEYNIQKLISQAHKEKIDLTDEELRKRATILTQQEALIKAQEDAAKEWKKLWENAVENVQKAWGEMIYQMLFVDGIDSFGDFADAVLGIFKRLVAEIIALWTLSLIGGLFKDIGISIPGLPGGNILTSAGTSVLGSKALAALGFGGTSAGVAGGISGTVAVTGATGGGLSGLGSLSGGLSGEIGSGGLMSGGAGLGGAIPVVGWALASYALLSSIDTQSVEEKFREAYARAGTDSAGIFWENFAQEYDQDGVEVANQTIGAVYAMVGENAQLAANDIAEIFDETWVKVVDGTGVAVGDIEGYHREAVQTILRFYSGELQPGFRDVLRNMDLHSQQVANAIADGLVTSAELASLGFQNMEDMGTSAFRSLLQWSGQTADALNAIPRNIDISFRVNQKTFGGSLYDQDGVPISSGSANPYYDPNSDPAYYATESASAGSTDWQNSWDYDQYGNWIDTAQHGGTFIATRPRLVRVGEVGPEQLTVTPLTGRRPGGGSPVVVQLNGPAIFDEVSMVRFARTVTRAQERLTI